MSSLALFKVVVALDLVEPSQEVGVRAGAREVGMGGDKLESVGGIQHAGRKRRSVPRRAVEASPTLS